MRGFVLFLVCALCLSLVASAFAGGCCEPVKACAPVKVCAPCQSQTVLEVPVVVGVTRTVEKTKAVTKTGTAVCRAPCRARPLLHVRLVHRTRCGC
jgi:hypothetical protein